MTRLIGTLLAALLIPAVVLGDDWKGGKGKDWKGWKGGGGGGGGGGNWKAKDWDDDDWDDNGWKSGAPGWSRGRGYWDGSSSPAVPYGPVLPFGSDGDGGVWIESNQSSLIPWSLGVQQEIPTTDGRSAGQNLSEADARTLRRMAYESLATFDQWLAQIPAGEMWRRHFETRAGLERLSPDREAVPTPADQLPAASIAANPAADDQATFARMLGTFDEAVENTDLAAITQTDGFRRSRAALRELAAPAEERLVRQLSLTARTLNRSLAGLSTGPKWQRYLALPDDILAAADRPFDTTQPAHVVDRDALVPVLGRFDIVSRSPEFRTIAALPAFEATHQKLTALLHPQPPQEAARPPLLPAAPQPR